MRKLVEEPRVGGQSGETDHGPRNRDTGERKRRDTNGLYPSARCREPEEEGPKEDFRRDDGGSDRRRHAGIVAIAPDDGEAQRQQARDRSDEDVLNDWIPEEHDPVAPPVADLEHAERERRGEQ